MLLDIVRKIMCSGFQNEKRPVLENTERIEDDLGIMEKITAKILLESYPQALTYVEIAKRCNLRVKQVKKACKSLNMRGYILKGQKETFWGNDCTLIQPTEQLLKHGKNLLK